MSLPSTDTSSTTQTTPAPPPPPAPAPSVGAGLSQGIIAVLRLIVTDADFRAKFAQDPIYAITSADVTITSDDLARLTALTPDQLDQVAQGISVLANSTANAAGLTAVHEGTHTLIWAIVVAVLLAAQAKR